MNEKDIELIKEGKLSKDVLIKGLEEIKLKLDRKQREYDIFMNADVELYKNPNNSGVQNLPEVLQLTKEITCDKLKIELDFLNEDIRMVTEEIEKFDELVKND